MTSELPQITSSRDYKLLLRETVKFNKDTRLEDATKFLSNMLDEPKYFVESFIANDLKAYFGFTNNDLKPIKIFYKEAQKTHYKLKHTESIKNDLHIDKKYNNMYTISVTNSGKVSIDIHPDIISDLILSENNIITHKDSMFIFRNGFYRYEPETVTDIVTKTINDICKGDHSRQISSKINDVIAQIQTKSRSYVYPFNNHKNSIPVENGVLIFDFESGKCKLVMHDPKLFRFNYKIPVSYNPNNENDRILNDLLKEYMDNPIELIEIFAQSFMQAMGYGPYKRAYFIFGVKNTGKTTFVDLLQNFVGIERISDINFEQFNQRFQTAALEGKLFNLHDDVGYFTLKDTGTFKTLTGRKEHQVERKFVDPYVATITAVHVFTTNTPARFDSTVKNDDAFWERIKFITFSKVFKMNAEFQEKMFTDENLEGFFNVIINEMLRIGKNKRLTTAVNWYVTREEWTLASNPLYAMVKDLMESKEISLESIELEDTTLRGTYIIKDELLKILQLWCLKNKVDEKLIPDSIKDLTTLVNNCGWDTDHRKKFVGHDTEKHCYFIPYKWKSTDEAIKYFTKTSGLVEIDHKLDEVEKACNEQLDSEERPKGKPIIPVSYEKVKISKTSKYRCKNILKALS